MNLTLHLIRKDLRQFRLPALFWAALVAAQILFTTWLLFPDTSNNDWYIIMCGFTNLLYFLGLVFGNLFAGMIVLADPPGSSVALWQTRPISGRRLLAAKAVSGFLILGALTLLLWLPWWIYCGFGAGHIVQTAAIVLAVTLIPAVIGAALAALVDQATRFVMLTMILVAALIVFAITALVPRTISPTLYGTRLILDLLCFMVAALAAVVTQYLTRQTIKSGAVLIAGVVVVMMIRAWWPVDLVAPIGERLASYWDKSQGVMAGAEKISGRIWRAEARSRNNKDGIAEPFIVVKLGLAGVPEDVFVSGGSADIELSWPDGTTVRREKVWITEDDWYNRSVPLQHVLGFPAERNARSVHWDPETRAKNEALRAEFERHRAEQGFRQKVPAYVLPTDLSSSLRCEVPVSPAIATKARQIPPACRIVATLKVKRPVILGEVPLVVGASIVNDSRLRVVKLDRMVLEQKGSRWTIDVQYSGAISLVKPAFNPNSSLYLVDRTHQVIDGWLSSNTIQAVAPMSGWVSLISFGFPPPALWRTDHWVEVPDWQKTFTLVEEESRPAGSFTYTSTTDQLEVSEVADQ